MSARAGVVLAIAVGTGVSCGGSAEEAPALGPDLTSFEAELAEALDGRTVVFDFFTTWCGPCKRLDAETWADPEVRAWFDEHASLVKVDAEAELRLAAKYSVNAYPTIVFVDGSFNELDRIVGFRGPDEFLVEAKQILAGEGWRDRLEARLPDRQTDPMQRGNYADELARRGLHEEALEHYLWCFDHGLEHRPSYYGVRLSFLLSDIADLARSHEPARKALVERRAAARRLFLESAERATVVRAAGEFTSIGEELGESNLELYHEVRESDDAWRLTVLGGDLGEELIAAGLYREYLDGGATILDRALQTRSVALPEGADVDETMRDLLEGVRRERFRRAAALHVEALVGAGRTDGLESVVAEVFLADPASETFAALIEAALKAGDPDAARAIAAWAERDLPEAVLAPVREAASHIPD